MRDRIADLGREHHLEPGCLEVLGSLLALLGADEHAPTTVRSPAQAVDRHVADSLSALVLAALDRAHLLVDLGSGAGLPGLALAAARPNTRVALVESSARKAAFLRSAVAALDLPRVAVIERRVEQWDEGAGQADVVTARALAPLGVVLEYAAPLLGSQGTVIAWKGRRDVAEERVAEAAARQLGLGLVEVRAVEPFSGARHHHLHVYRRIAPTPGRFPRRPGMARKRPLGMA